MDFDLLRRNGSHNHQKMIYQNTLAFAKELDNQDPLRDSKKNYLFPKDKNGDDVIYMCGNSLGLQPNITKDYISQVLDSWENRAVRGHFEGNRPYTKYHEKLAELAAPIVGAYPEEIVYMNTLTLNVHLLMVSFYRPSGDRYKILMEKKPFPSDVYAVKSQLRWHGYPEEEGIIHPDTIHAGTNMHTTDQILECIEKHKDELCLILLGAVNYYTGQAFDIEKIARKAKEYNITIGLDCAHAAGNIPLKLHDHDIDFAAWCSYKYMNAGPGSLSGAYIHKKHHKDTDIQRFEGWWGYNKEQRFQMTEEFIPIESAEAWNISNPPIMALAPVLSALELFSAYDFNQEIVPKSKQLTSYLAYLIQEDLRDHIEINTPEESTSRGCQLSLRFNGKDKRFHTHIMDSGIICDWREPGTVRVAPTPLYTTYSDVYTMVQRLKKLL